MTRSLPECYPLDPSRIDQAYLIVEKIKKKLKKENKWMIHIELLDFISYKTDKEPVYIEEGSSNRNILNESTILNLLSNRGEANYFLYLDKGINKKQSEALLRKLKSVYCILNPAGK